VRSPLPAQQTTVLRGVSSTSKCPVIEAADARKPLILTALWVNRAVSISFPKEGRIGVQADGPSPLRGSTRRKPNDFAICVGHR
jgi:hypothetical protein